MRLPIWAAEGGGKGGERGARSLSCRRDGDISRVPVRMRGEPRDLHASLGAGQRDPGRVRDAPDPFLIPPVAKGGTESQSWALAPCAFISPSAKWDLGHGSCLVHAAMGGWERIQQGAKSHTDVQGWAQVPRTPLGHFG